MSTKGITSRIAEYCFDFLENSSDVKDVVRVR